MLIWSRVITVQIRLICCYDGSDCEAACLFVCLFGLFWLHFVSEMSCFYSRELCVTHKINALDDFVKTVRPAVSDISLCFRSQRHSAAHVVPRSHMGFKHRTRAGAAIVQKHWRGNKHKQHALSCLEVSFVPHGRLLCHLSVFTTHTAANP